MRRALRPLLLVSACAAAAAFLAGCVIVKPGSLQVTQPGGVGSVRVQLELCATNSFAYEERCEENGDSGEAQFLLAIAVPKGTAAPATIAATPGPDATPFTYFRNQEVADQMVIAGSGNEPPWPPPGTDIVGYLSEVVPEVEGALQEWKVSGDFGLPSAPDGGTFGGPFAASIAWGWREVNAEKPAGRPVVCPTEGPPFEYCFGSQEAEVGITDLRIAVPPTTRGLVGGTAAIQFPVEYASSVVPPPTLALAATSTLPGAKLGTAPAFTPGPLAEPTKRAATAASAVTVSVPAKAKPGIYDVTITATAPGGGSVSQTAKLRVAKPRIGFGKLKLNRKKGTATLQVKVFEAGTVTVSGKKVGKVKRTAKKRKTLKVVIRAKGKAKRALRGTGRAKVRAKVRFKPQNGAAVTKSRAIGLVKRLTS